MKEDRLLMSKKERDRKVIFESVREERLTLREASERLHLSYRQTRRQYQRYRLNGDNGLIHQSRGQRSNHGKGAVFKQEVLKLYRTHYEGFGPTFASEKLEAQGYHLHAETLRLWLKAEGLWASQRQRKAYRQHRTRKEKFGELLQLDGSIHCWFGRQGEYQCLMNLVDDATGKTMALLAEGETTEAIMRVVKKWVERYGIPKAIYVDLKTVYVSSKRLSDEEEKPGEGFTQFSLMCEKLGIKIIKAYSPQAKGRVERKHAVFQDRFVKELKLQNIHTIEKANKLLEKSFLDHLNHKFQKEPQSQEDAHRDPIPYGDLDQIFCWQYTRQVNQDWTVSFQANYYQILKTKELKVKPRDKISVRLHLNGKLSFWHQNHLLNYKPIKEKPLKPAAPITLSYNSAKRSQNASQKKSNSPWSLFNPRWIKKNKSKHVHLIREENAHYYY